MREEKTLKLFGLNTYSDIFSIPEGSFSVAENVVIDQNNLLSPRRGYEILTRDISGGGQITTSSGQTLFYYNSRVHLQLTSGEIYYYDPDADNWVFYGVDNTIVKPDSENRSRFVAANRNLYATSNQGVQKIDELGQTIRDSGAPEAFGAELEAELAGTVVDAGNSVAYRIVWGYKDNNKNLILGAPSERLVVQAVANAKFRLSIPIPTQIDSSLWFCQIYRTKQSAVIPNDELFLAAEFNPTPAQITAGIITGFVDEQVEERLGVPLYTNATQEGLANANFEAPQCVDVALYQGHVFYANTQRKSEIIFTLTATGGAYGVAENDQFIISDGTDTETYIAKASPTDIPNDGNDDGGTYEFTLVNLGSPQGDVEATARSLIAEINKKSDKYVAYYWSDISPDSTDFAGQIRITERDFNLAPNFTIQSTSNENAYIPSIDTAVASDAEIRPNRIYYSKFQEPEAVPLPNFFDVGPANSKILRIVPLRTSLLIFTEEAVYRLTGTTESAFQVNLLDNTAKLVATDSLAVLNNTVFGLFDQGVCSVGESVQILSRAIEGDLLEIRGATGDKLDSLSFGISYESDRKYIVYVPVNASDAANDETGLAYVYNTVTRSWTTWNKRFSHGIIDLREDKLFMLQSNGVRRERKSYTFTDIADEQVVFTPTGISGVVISVDSAIIDQVSVGDMYVETENKFSKIISIDELNNTITLQDDLVWTQVQSEVRKTIPIKVDWNPLYMDSSASLKQFSECTLVTKSALDALTLSFKGVSSGGFEDITFGDVSQGLWGLFPWGEVPWGGDPSIFRYRTYIPVQKQRDSAIFVRLSQNAVYNRFEISGISMMYRIIGPRTRR